MSIKEKLVKNLKEKKANVTIAYSNPKDENLSKYKFGEINLIEFINNITEDSECFIEEAFENNFLVIDKNKKLPPQSYLNPKSLKDLFTGDNVQKLCKNFPEINDLITKSYEEVQSASCTNCAKNGKSYRIIQEILFLDNRGKDLSELKPLFGEKFIEKINSNEPLPKPPPRPERPQPVADNNILSQEKRIKSNETNSLNKKNPINVDNAGPRPSCINCCMKHIGTAIVLMEEASNGYPVHKWLAVGELNEAANEIIRDFPDIAYNIREIRHSITEDNNHSYKIMELLNTLHEKFSA